MSLSCPICFKVGFTAISISTHVEVCIQRAARRDQQAQKVNQEVSAEIAPKKPKISRNIIENDRLNGISVRGSGMKGSGAVTERVSGEVVSHSGSGSGSGSGSSGGQETDSPVSLSVYESLTAEDLTSLLAKASNGPRISYDPPMIRHHHPSHHQRSLLHNLQCQRSSTSALSYPLLSASDTDTIIKRLDSTLLHSFTAQCLRPPPPDQIPDHYFCPSENSKTNNSLYLSFWDGEPRAINDVYSRVLHDTIANQFPLKVNALDESKKYVSTMSVDHDDWGDVMGGYCSWTVEDLANICETPTELPAATPPLPTNVAEVQSKVHTPLLSAALSDSSLTTPSSSHKADDDIGHAMCTRPGGGTIRDAVDIDESNTCSYRLQYEETFFFTKLQSLAPPDEECVAVIRLYGYVLRDGRRLFGWASLTGRTVEDHESILYITKAPVWLANHPLKDEVLAALPSPPPASSKTHHQSQPDSINVTTGSGPAILATSNCPLCDAIFTANMTLPEREAHVNECLSNMQDDLFSQTN